MNFDPEAAQRIRDIAAAKDKAVRAEVTTLRAHCFALYNSGSADRWGVALII